MLRIGLITLAFTCSSLATVASDQLNVLLICIDDLRPELNCFGADYIHSPNIDRLSASGRAFHHHYVNAPTCGASRYTLLTGTYGPSSNYGLFERVKRLNQRLDTVTPSMPA
jgi:iduronate 2-sulfatase